MAPFPSNKGFTDTLRPVRMECDILDLELRPGATPVLVGRAAGDLRPLDLPLPRRDSGGCWSSPPRRSR